MDDKKDPDLFDAAASREARDEGLEQVEEAAGAWMSMATAAVEALPAGWEGTGEDIRIMSAGMPPPHHHNAWGAMINTCVRKGWLVWTGEIRNMRSVRSHARATKVYRRT